MAYTENNKEILTSFLLRAGLCIVFLYAGTASLVNSANWIGFVPQWINNFISREAFLVAHGIADIFIGMWLISNFKPFWAGFAASLSLIAVISVNFAQLEIIFRDVAILFSALSLMAITYKKR